MQYLQTPLLLKQAETYYNCPEASKFALETSKDIDDPYSANWDKNLVGEEVMTNFLFKPKYSVFTMALLEDSGWYKPDYTMADNLFHG